MGRYLRRIDRTNHSGQDTLYHTPHGAGCVSEKHEYYYRELPPYREDIDVIVAMGLKVGFLDGYGAQWPETIQISDSASQIWTYLPTSTAILGNSKIVARHIIDYIKANDIAHPPERHAWIERV